VVDKKVFVGTAEQLLADDHPWISAYLRGPRGRAAQDVGRQLRLAFGRASG
jgi:hypothetical protein